MNGNDPAGVWRRLLKLAADCKLLRWQPSVYSEANSLLASLEDLIPSVDGRLRDLLQAASGAVVDIGQAYTNPRYIYRSTRPWIMPNSQEWMEAEEEKRAGIEAAIERLIVVGEAILQECGEATPRPNQQEGGLRPQELAIALLLKDPTMTNTEIAKRVGVSRTTLNKFTWRRFQDVRHALANNLPSGEKDGKTGAIESWE